MSTRDLVTDFATSYAYQLIDNVRSMTHEQLTAHIEGAANSPQLAALVMMQLALWIDPTTATRGSLAALEQAAIYERRYLHGEQEAAA